MSSLPANTTTTPPFVTVHALSAGQFTLPCHHFVIPVSHTARKTVPSLSFLIQHHSATGKVTRILFDLGLRRDTTKYSPPIQKHITTRQPMSTDPDVVASLAKGGLEPKDIDHVIYSHVHWDHIGTPSDFPHSTFIVGHGSLALLANTNPSLTGTHSFFEPDLLPPDRTLELPPTAPTTPRPRPAAEPDTSAPSFSRPWLPHPTPSLALPHTLDVFADASLYIVDAPGHLPGHVNILAHTPHGLVYLAGDTYHDRRLLTGEKEVAEWVDDAGRTCCIHADIRAARDMLGVVRGLVGQGVQVCGAHDGEGVEGRVRWWGEGERAGE